MLFIENYQDAKDYHNGLLKCWFNSKLYTETERRNNQFQCTIRNCPSCVKDRKYYSKTLHEDIRRLIKQNIDCILTGEVGQLVEFYETNSSLLNENSLEIENFFVNSAYKNFFQTNCAEEFLNLLNKNTCIYCNRNYTLAIVKGRTRAEIDHWLPKTHFPIFAVSFYNLIPSCHSCNHLKGAGEDAEWWVKNHKEIANPYSDKGTFDFNYTFSKSKNEFEITFENVSNPKIRRMIKENRLRCIFR